MPALTLLYPPAGPLGFNLLISGTGGLGPGDTVEAYLRRPGIANTVARGTHTHAGSGSTWSLRFTHHVDIGCDQGAAIDLTIEWRDASATLIDSQVITGTYTNDSITGLGPLVMAGGGGAHDPMLDEILASVRKTYTSF